MDSNGPNDSMNMMMVDGDDDDHKDKKKITS